MLPFTWDEDKQLFCDNDGKYIKMIQTFGTNLFGFKEIDQDAYMSAFQYIFSNSVGKGQIFSYEVAADVDGYIEDMEHQKSTLNVIHDEQDRIRYKILLDNQERLKYTAITREMVDRTFLFILKDDDLHRLEQRCNEVINNLNPYQKTVMMESSEMINVLYNYYHPRNNKVAERMAGECDDLMDFLYPDVIEKESHGFKRQFLRMDGLVMKIRYVSLYKKAPAMAFLSYLSSLSNVDFSLHFERAEADAIKKEVTKDLKNIRKNLDKAKPGVEEKELQLQEVQMDDVLNKMVSGSDSPVRFSVTIRLKGETIEDVESWSQEIDKKLNEVDITLRDGIYQQKEMFLHNSPICHNAVEEYMKTTTNDTLGWGYPFVFESLYDSVEVGEYTTETNVTKKIRMPSVYLGNTVQTGGVMFYDNFTKMDDRSNYNEFIVGVSGSGKTFMVMWLIYVRFALGYHQFIVDVEGKELNKLTYHLKGENINGANGRRGRINPLQVRFIIPDDENSDKDEDDKKIPLEEIYPLSEHIRFTRNFFKAYKAGSKEIELLHDSTIEDALIECYKDKDITFDTTAKTLVDEYTNDMYPVMKDLYNKLISWKKDRVDKYEKSGFEEKIYIDMEEIKIINQCIAFVKPLAVGADADIFNGHTTIDLSNKLICFNISGLNDNTDNKVLRTQYYNIMSYIWTSVISNPNRIRQQIYADELSVIMDERNVDVMLFFHNIAKRIRKYYGGLTTATQQMSDMLKKEIRSYGEAIIENSCYEFYFGMGSNDIERVEKTNALPKSEIEFIKTAKIGQCYARIGKATAMRVQISPPQHTLELFESMKS